MKTYLFIIMCLWGLGFSSHAQLSKNWSIDVSAGTTMPMGEYARYVKADKTIDVFATPMQGFGFTQTTTGNLQFNADITYNFGAFGLGISGGQFSHQISAVHYNIAMPVLLEVGTISGNYYGLGAQYAYVLGKLKMVAMLRGGMMNFSMPDNFKVYYDATDINPINIRETGFENTSLAYASSGLKISYTLGKHFELFTKVDYFTTFGDGILFQEEFYYPVDIRNDGTIDDMDASHFTVEELLVQDEYYVKPAMLNIGAGITYKIPLGIPKNSKETKNLHLTDRKIEQDNKEEPTRIVLVSPENGASFTPDKALKKFTWKVTGKPFKNPVFIVEVRSLQNQGRSYTGQTTATSISAAEVLKDARLSGSYSWRVVERNTGNSSNPQTFYYNDCDVDMQISNVEVECLGYVDAGRQYKICFDLTYQSSVGDLTYNNPGSGLSVYDQNYSPLTYTLTGSNTTLQTQTGATASTVHYCFETTVDNTVNQIGFGLQGDDLDPSPVTCQPGVSNGIDELPSCLCDECERVQITAEGINITADSQNSSVFAFDGNINVNVPVYGIEFQLLSMNYSTNPGTCTNGVTSVETSGIFLQNGTMINNSSSIQFLNESASNSGLSNNNASRNIKYMSSGAMNGNIPVHLNIGLPQPLQGLNADCCQIDYTLCMKIIVYYENGTCKTCQVTKCFNFNNQ